MPGAPQSLYKDANINLVKLSYSSEFTLRYYHSWEHFV